MASATPGISSAPAVWAILVAADEIRKERPAMSAASRGRTIGSSAGGVCKVGEIKADEPRPV